MNDNPFVGRWTYRSFLNDPDASVKPNDLLFGSGTIVIMEMFEERPVPMQILHGTIGGEGWSLDLYGARSYGNPMAVNFRGTGVVSGSEWIYDYVGYLVPQWPNGVQQRAAMVGSIVRAIPHPSSGGGVSPAGVVASWYAVRQDDVGSHFIPKVQP